MHLPDMLWTTSWIRSKTLIINTPTKNSGDTGFRWCHEIPTKTHLPITPQRRSIKGELGNTKAEIQSLDPKLVSTFLCPYLHHVFTSLQLLLKSAATSIDHQVSSKGCTEQQTELCPNRIRTSKHQTMCHHLSDLWRYGCRFKRFCHCLACQLPCFCSWLIFESMEAHCCFGVCKYRCPSEIVRNSLCLRSFRPLLNLLSTLPQRETELRDWISPPHGSANFTQESFQTIREVWSAQGMKRTCLNQSKHDGMTWFWWCMNIGDI